MKRFNWLVLGFVAIFALVLTGCSQSVETHDHDVQEITVVATEFAFSPSDITIETNRLVRLTLANEGITDHEWEVETPSGDIHIHAMAGESNVVEFMLSRPGTYEIVCDIPGHLEAGMHGTLTVTGPERGHDVIPTSNNEEAEHGDVDASSVLTGIYIVDSFGFHGMGSAYDEATEVGSRDAGNVKKVLLAVQATAWPEALEHQAEALVEDLHALHGALEAADLEASREALHAVHETQHDLSIAAYLWIESNVPGEEFDAHEDHDH